jgi:hypothetical protein
VIADIPAVSAAHRTAKIIEARNLVKPFGETPALRGAPLGVRRADLSCSRQETVAQPDTVPVGSGQQFGKVEVRTGLALASSRRRR